MNPESSRFVPHSRHTYVVTITSYADKRLCGELYSASMDRAFRFDSLMQLLLLMEALMDQGNYPQRGMEPRAFRTEQSISLLQTGTPKTGGPALASFKIDVLFRQNASWQGSIVWSEHQLESHFRSVLELLGLMDDALVMAEADLESSEA